VLLVYDNNNDNQSVGYALITLGICILLYQMAFYWNRQNLITAKKKDFTDPVGISIIAAAVVVVLSFAGYFVAQSTSAGSSKMVGGVLGGRGGAAV